MEIYKATLKDIDDLVQLRIDFLKMDHGHISDQNENIIRKQSREYFEKHIPIDDFIAVIAKDNIGKIMSAAFLIIQECPANPSFMTGRTGILLNVITYPEYRRRGIATQVLQSLIEEAKIKSISSIDLSATDEGKGLYEKMGFSVSPYTAMRLKL